MSNVMDLPTPTGFFTAFRRLGPYVKNAISQTPLLRTYFASYRWVRGKLNLPTWVPPSRAARFEELGYLRNKPNFRPTYGRSGSLTWDSVPDSSFPLAVIGETLGEGFGNRVYRATLQDGSEIAVKARKQDLTPYGHFTTRDQLFSHEVDGAGNLHDFLGGPAARIVRFEENGEMRVGLGLDLVEGKPLAKFLSGEATDFPVTEAHVQSVRQLFERLDELGAWLEDLHDGQLMLRADGRVVPLDMRLEALGNGNPMVLEYARRRAGILDQMSELAAGAQ